MSSHNLHYFVTVPRTTQCHREPEEGSDDETKHHDDLEPNVLFLLEHTNAGLGVRNEVALERSVVGGDDFHAEQCDRFIIKCQ